MIWIAFLLLGLFFTWISLRFGCLLLRIRSRRRALLIAPTLPFILVALVGFAGGGYMYWYAHRSQPSAESRELFRGIHYTRDVRQLPRPMVIHVARIELDAPDLRFLVTPSDGAPGYDLKA